MQSYEVPASQRDRHLPMIVHLRGDEELMDSFTYDADQAMEFLGIKRSRLTQIAGRELRVGRIRRDRYIRPVFRECDLKDYQEWTRATATHQTSSRAIEQAIDSLDDRFNDLFVVLQERSQQSQEESHRLIERGIQRIRELTRRDLARELRELENQHNFRFDEVKQQLTSVRRNQIALQTEVKELAELMTQTEQRMASYHQDFRELVSGLLLLRRDVQDMRDHLLSETLALREDWKAENQQRELREQAQSQAFSLTITNQTHEVRLARDEFARASRERSDSRSQKPKKARTLVPQRRLPYLAQP